MASRVNNIADLGLGSPELDAAIAKLDVLGAAAAGFADARRQAKIQNSETAWLDALDEIIARETYRCARAITKATRPNRECG